jgi:hypothetical protein
LLALSLEQAQKSKLEFQQSIVESKTGLPYFNCPFHDFHLFLILGTLGFLFPFGEGKELKVSPQDILHLILQQLKKV